MNYQKWPFVVASALIGIGLSTAQQACAQPDCSGPWTPEVAQCLKDSATPASQQEAVWSYKHGGDVCGFFRQDGVNITTLTQAKTYLTGTIGFSPARSADVVTSSVLWNCPEYSMAVGNIN